MYSGREKKRRSRIPQKRPPYLRDDDRHLVPGKGKEKGEVVVRQTIGFKESIVESTWFADTEERKKPLARKRPRRAKDLRR